MPVLRSLSALALALACAAAALPDAPALAHPPAPAATAIRGAAAPPDSSWLEWNPATKSLKFKLVAGLIGRGAKSPFNFNGYVDGELTLVVPVAANVVMSFVNEDGTPHSAVVIPDTLPLPTMADQAAIPRAYTTKASEGLGYYATDVMRFKAAPAGRYLIYCGVPGHGLSGMWIRLRVDSTTSAPAMLETPTNR
ncbi:MAG: sulfocyanin-like copper-binding protein [Gemmatimonadota bacterium]|nr:sulfocyanin-like copper-binding protein [Gemmatimonadota bacterium]